MNSEFLERMKKVRDTRKPNEGMASIVDNDDFIKLVEMAERAAYLEDGFKQHYHEVCRKEASKPYELYDPTEPQTLQVLAYVLKININ